MVYLIFFLLRVFESTFACDSLSSHPQQNVSAVWLWPSHFLSRRQEFLIDSLQVNFLRYLVISSRIHECYRNIRDNILALPFFFSWEVDEIRVTTNRPTSCPDCKCISNNVPCISRSRNLPLHGTRSKNCANMTYALDVTCATRWCRFELGHTFSNVLAQYASKY